MDFLEKLNLLMAQNNYNKNSLSKASGIPYTTIDNWYKRGYDNLQLPTVKKLCSFFHTSLDFWLKEDVTDPNYGKASGFKVEYSEAEHIKKYRSLDSIGKETVDFILDREAIRSKESKEQKEYIIELENLSQEEHQRNAKTRLINYYYRLASAGTGQIIFDTPPTKRIEIPDIPKYRHVDYAIGVNGVSMEPTYRDNDTLLVEMTDEVDKGEVGIFSVDNNCYVKKLGDGELISLNHDFPNIPLNESSRCMGKVIDKLGEE